MKYLVMILGVLTPGTTNDEEMKVQIAIALDNIGVQTDSTDVIFKATEEVPDVES